VQAAFGVYAGTVELKDGLLRVLPLQRFFREMAEGKVLCGCGRRDRTGYDDI
jgi:hypothetical protein